MLAVDHLVRLFDNGCCFLRSHNTQHTAPLWRTCLCVSSPSSSSSAIFLTLDRHSRRLVLVHWKCVGLFGFLREWMGANVALFAALMCFCLGTAIAEIVSVRFFPSPRFPPPRQANPRPHRLTLPMEDSTLPPLTSSPRSTRPSSDGAFPPLSPLSFHELTQHHVPQDRRVAQPPWTGRRSRLDRVWTVGNDPQRRYDRHRREVHPDGWTHCRPVRRSPGHSRSHQRELSFLLLASFFPPRSKPPLVSLHCELTLCLPQSLGTKILAMVTKTFVFVNLGAVVAICIALLVTTNDKHSAEYIFTSTTNNTGWESSGITFLLGLLSVQWTMTVRFASPFLARRKC